MTINVSTTVVVLRSVDPHDSQEVLYTPGTRKKRPGGRRKEVSDIKYDDHPKKVVEGHSKNWKPQPHTSNLSPHKLIV